jgi:hypothetical protein
MPGMYEMSYDETRMSDAMHRLNELAPQGAPATLGDGLKDEFLRHHARRRRTRAVRVLVAAAGLAAIVAMPILLLRPRPSSTRARQEDSQNSPRPNSISASLIGPRVPQQEVHKSSAHAGISARTAAKAQKGTPSDSDRFVALPTYDPAIPIGDLQMVRLDLPGRELQLVGFPVPEDIADRRVIADVLLAQDGTPYALRLVRSTGAKEQ